MLRLAVTFSMVCTLVACVSDDEGPYAGHEEISDFDEPEIDEAALATVMPSTFDKNVVVWDAHFQGEMSAEAVQRFLERSPYGNRSWLASERINGKSAAEALVSAGERFNINPLMLLARIQVERSAVSKSARPRRQHDVDYLMGCGCPDTRRCYSSYRGIDKQLACTARTLREGFDGSSNGTGGWRKDNSRRSLDRISVTPGNHSTASLYNYTPWVGNGGNKLVWNVTYKFTRHAQNQVR